MNQQAITQLVNLIYAHYQNLGGYRLIPNNTDITGFPGIKLLQVRYSSLDDLGYYLSSITLDSVVVSSRTQERLQLHPLNKYNLYWIHEQQGFNNARIIAHIFSWGLNENELFAQVSEY